MRTSDIGLDVFNPQVIARPHEFYARLRHEAPIIWSDQLQAWLLTKYDDVRTVIRDHEHWSSIRDERSAATRNRGDETVAPPGTLTMLSSDPPDHTRLRKLLDRDFTPGKMALLIPHIEEVTERLVAGASSNETFDVAEDLAVPLPVTIIAELLGVPPELGRQFKRWSDAATEPMHPDASDEEIAARNAEVVEFRNYLNDRIADRRRQPSDDFIGRIVQARDDEERLSDDEVLAAVNLLLLAGNETTTNLISNATLALWKFPGQQRALRDDPSLMDRAIEEFLRYDGSVQFTTRRALVPAEFHGQRVEAGESVAIVLASANRDESVFANPDELDFNRPRGKHFAFGDWIHVCIGQYLARFETKAALTHLLEEFPEFDLCVPETEIPYRRNFNLRGPKHLLIRNVPTGTGGKESS